MSALAVLDEIIADMGGDTPGTPGYRLAQVREDAAKLMQEARLALYALQEVAPDRCAGTIHAISDALARVGGAA